MPNYIPFEYKVIVYDDNIHYLERLQKAISSVNYKNQKYQLLIKCVTSQELFISQVQSEDYNVIILVIITPEDDGILFVALEFALLDEFFLFYTDAFEKDGGRLVGGILRDELAADG